MTALNDPKNWLILVLLVFLLTIMFIIIKHHNDEVYISKTYTGIEKYQV
jgi:hypothetical protein